MTADRWGGIADLLSRLEALELPLLSWGVVDGFMSREEVDEAIDEQLVVDARGATATLPSGGEYLQHLLDTGLLHQLPDPTPRYRTRLGETLRLLRRLRQLWPPNDPTVAGWWRNSSTLVADYRLRVAPRRYPRRSITADQAITELATSPNWTALHAHVLTRLVGGSLLASFQVQASSSILGALAGSVMSARIITAGTGSGKTLAFYLPAFMDIAATADTIRTGPHTLALYPRNELLRDQAREALRAVTQLGPLGGPNSRPARIALLYGDTPWEAELQVGKTPSKWKRHGQGWACPYFTCLTDDCRGTLMWSDADRAERNERLVCSVCNYTTRPGTIALTRESMTVRPADILFSSTEMLSQQSTSLDLGRMLGWRGAVGTRLVLLDEVHTYSGAHGAQVGLMLRRLRQANRQWGASAPVVVGLSATLRDASEFFATLTGTERSNVEVIAPQSHDMLPISREYGIVLRGDPISGASLLSTTIQTAMLLGRMLDTTPGIYGSVTFAFTDNLDVINRLYDNLRNAEGILPTGRPGAPILADLRSPQAPQAADRYLDGQSWDLPAHLQRMERALRVARTSSQDVGTDSNADIITATSSLEVGFNDPRVGAVIQHKAPRDVASFLQRRGRAGRSLEMRPVTVVVLSDYGRDRIAYQTYEKLLDPEIDARSLPINNRYIIKMQATHALLDWLARTTGADVRAILTQPRTDWYDPKTGQVVDTLQNVLANSARQDELAEYLRRSMRLTPDDVQAAMWEEPRSLLLSVVPTALRRLESAWHTLPGDTDPGAQERAPLPEFMTPTLFASLNTPDVQFELPAGFSDQRATMPIAQALRDAVPGRVSRRFGYANANSRTWLPVPAPGQSLELKDIIARGHWLGTWTTAEGQVYDVVRPLSLRLTSPPQSVVDTSNAMPLWRSAFAYDEVALRHADMPTPSVWADLVHTCAFALHVAGGPLTVRRMTIGSDGELLQQNGTRTTVHVRYSNNTQAAALGFELEVDAMILAGKLAPADSGFQQPFATTAQWRTLAFRRRVLEDTRLDDIANVFQRQWLAEVYLHAFIADGLTRTTKQDLARTPDKLAGGRWAVDLAQFLAIAYRADQNAVVGQARALTDLTALSADPTVRAVIEEHGKLLGAADLQSRTSDLLDRVFLDTLANAILSAAEWTLPDAQESDLAVDVEFDPATRGYTVIVSETSIGGLGLIEALHRDYAQDPREFWDAVARACSPTEAEDVDEAMQDVLANLANPPTPFAQSVAAFRSATGVAQMDRALGDLLATWTESDGPPGHLLVSTFAARLLRPGSNVTIDSLVADLATAWTQQEARLGVEIDARTLVFHAAQGNLGVNLAPLTPDAAFSLLWLRGPQARAQRLEHWHPYRDDVVIERLALDSVIRDRTSTLDVTQPGWIEDYVKAMEIDGRVILRAPYPRRAELAESIRQATVTAAERHGLRLYGHVTGIHQRRGTLQATLSLAEEPQ